MDILYATRELEQLCLREREARRQLGAPCAKKLRARLEDLASVKCVSELIAGRPHPLHGSRAGQFAVSLAGGFRLVFEPAAERNHQGENERHIAWEKVDSVRIVYIGDYHD